MRDRYGRRYELLRKILRERREALDITQRELSAKLGRDKNFVQLVESGERLIDAIEFIDYCRALLLDPKRVLGKLL